MWKQFKNGRTTRIYDMSGKIDIPQGFYVVGYPGSAPGRQLLNEAGDVLVEDTWHASDDGGKFGNDYSFLCRVREYLKAL